MLLSSGAASCLLLLLRRLPGGRADWVRTVSGCAAPLVLLVVPSLGRGSACRAWVGRSGMAVGHRVAALCVLDRPGRVWHLCGRPSGGGPPPPPRAPAPPG